MPFGKVFFVFDEVMELQALDFEEIVKRVCQETGKSREEVEQLVLEKKEKFSGLLTDTGAAFIVAKELGLELDAQRDFAERKKINELNDGLKNVDVLVRVKQIFSEKEFEKNGKKGRLCNLIVEDETGDCRLTVWSKQVEELGNLKRGELLLLKNAYTSSFREKIQLNIGFAGQIVFNPNESMPLEEIKEIEKKLNELTEGMENIDVSCRVLNIFPIKEFEKEKSSGKVINFQIGDETKVMRAAAWNDLAEKVNKLKEGDLLKIEGAYIKKGRNEFELNLGWNSRIIVNPENVEGVPPLETLRNEKFDKKEINALTHYDQNVEITGRIIAVRKGKLHYLVCPKCNKKAQELGTGFVCDKCGEIKKPGINPVITILVDDSKGVIQATFFGRQAERIMQKSNSELKKELEEKQVEEIIKEIENSISGKEITVRGNVQENSLNPDELEFIGREIKEMKEKNNEEEFTGNEVSENI